MSSSEFDQLTTGSVYESVLDLLPVGITLVDASGRTRQCNAAAEKLLHISRSELQKRSFKDWSFALLRRDGSPMPAAEIPAAVAIAQGRAVENVELGIVRAAGPVVWLQVSATPLPDGGAMVSYIDISVRHRDEAINAARARLLDAGARATLDEVLRAALNEVESLTRSHASLYQVVDRDRASVSLLALSNASEAQFGPMTRKGVEVPIAASGIWRQCLETARPVIENDAARLVGQPEFPESEDRIARQIVVPVVRWGRVVAILAAANKLDDYDANDTDLVHRFADLARELVEHKRAELALLERELRFRGIFDLAPDAISISRARDSVILEVNAEWCRMFRIDRSTAIGQTTLELKLWQDELARQRALDDAYAGSLAPTAARLRRSDGTTFDALISARTFDIEGERCGIIVTKDVTEIVHAQQKLAASEARFRRLFEVLPVGVTITDPNGQIILSNDASEKLLGIPAGELVRRELAGPHWEIIRANGSVMPVEEYASVRALREHRRIAGVEKGVRRPDGTVAWITVNAEPANHPDFGVIIVYSDITDRKRAEVDLRRKEENFRSFFDSLEDCVFVIDRNGTVLRVNATVTRLLGFTEGDILGKSALSVHPLNRFEEAREIFVDIQAGHQRVCPVPLVTNRGNIVQVETHFSKGLWDGEDAFFAVSKDLSELQASEEKFSKVFHASTDCIRIVDRTTTEIIDVNEAFERLFGYSREEAIGKASRDLAIWADEADCSRMFEAVNAGEALRHQQVRMRSRSGRPLWGEFSAFPIELSGRSCIVNTIRDITETKDAEDKIRMLYQAVEQSPVSVVITDAAGNIEYVNRAFTHVSGYTLEEVLGRNPRIVKSGETPPGVYEDLWRTILAGRVWRGEFVNRRKNGHTFHEEATIAGVRDGRGDITHFIAVKQDVTAARKAQQELRESERFLKQAQRSSKAGTYIYELSAGVWHSGPELDAIFGIDPDYDHSLDGWLNVVAPEWRDLVAAYLRHVVNDRDVFDLDYEIVRHDDGERHWVHGRGELELDARGEPTRLVGLVQDITDRKAAEDELRRTREQLYQAQKMESLGLLAGGVAHDMNNVLAAILGLATAHAETEPQGSEIGEALATIANACVRGRNMVRSLLDFARQQLSEEKILDLNAILEDEASILMRTTLQKIKIELDLDPGIHAVKGDPSALHHAFMNVCLNSVDAMPDGGILSLRTRNVEPSSVQVTISDSGQGMSPEVAARAFDPFFTTKHDGKGTGLGLSMVYGTIKAHRGDIELKSDPGFGTQVLIRFPAEDVPLQRAAGAAAGAAKAAERKNLRVLLVDDDEVVRFSVSRLLQRLGHKVTAADSGEAAIELVKGGLPVDLVVLDMSMPGLGGNGTVPPLRTLRPAVPILLATGLVDDRVTKLLQTFDNISVLPKPFSLDEIRKALASTNI